MIVRKAFRFKLDGTPRQEQQFRQYAGSVRWVYNRMLAERREVFKAGGNPRQPTSRSSSFRR
ncbi:MAG: helix-turn-helix domain-containing protein [Anaerolineae bacterium]|nr:helix-turn-helix domain-containing protein [Anaerolineae bacterium]